MNTPLPPALWLSAPIPGAVKKKRVPLVDTSQAKRELRAEVMRKLGMDADRAADIAEAHSWWRAALYDLVLIHMEKGRSQRYKVCDDVRSVTPSQRLALLVGQPEYLADSPNAADETPVDSADDLLVGGLKVASSADREDLTQRCASWNLHGESPQSAPRPSPAPKRCAPCPLRHEIPRTSIETNHDTDQPR